ncbi:MAG: hypothetical protein F6K11_18650 [Leptolyngbya sp. SIO3F4]|nr:hypothetical protein [Leptolyngbya sp. SIO3F4]
MLISAFRLSMLWDLLTTFLGSLLILNGVHFIAIGLSLVGTLVAGAFNFSTRAIWARGRNKQQEIHLLRFAWVLAILFDFWTSLICNVTYIALGKFELGRPTTWDYMSRLTWDQYLIVLVITLFTVMSPMMVGLIRKRNPDFLA